MTDPGKNLGTVCLNSNLSERVRIIDAELSILKCVTSSNEWLSLTRRREIDLQSHHYFSCMFRDLDLTPCSQRDACVNRRKLRELINENTLVKASELAECKDKVSGTDARALT